MAEVAFAIPGDIQTPTGGYAYDRQILRRLGDYGIEVLHLALPGSYPDPTAEDIDATLVRIAALPERTILLMDGLAFGALPADAIGRIGRTIVALVHHPLGMEAGLSPARASELLGTERNALQRAAAIIVTSGATARLLEGDFSVSKARIHVAEPGTEPALRATSSNGGPLRILAVGSLVPRKGYDVLIDALSGLAALDWRLTIVGAADRAPAYASHLQRLTTGAGIGGRITFTGALTEHEVAAHYASADLFVLASHFEGFGMVLTEALARGLPVVTTTGGAAAETLPDHAAIKVPPGNAKALRNALEVLLADPARRRSLGDAAWVEARNLTRWDETARIIARVLKEHGA